MDDIKAFYLDDTTILMLKEHLQSKYKLNNIKNVIWYLEMKISYLKNRSLFLSQKKYIDELLKCHEMKNCASTIIPMI